MTIFRLGTFKTLLASSSKHHHHSNKCLVTAQVLIIVICTNSGISMIYTSIFLPVEDLWLGAGGCSFICWDRVSPHSPS
jgi:hypothetical protein